MLGARGTIAVQLQYNCSTIAVQSRYNFFVGLICVWYFAKTVMGEKKQFGAAIRGVPNFGRYLTVNVDTDFNGTITGI